MIAYKQRVMDMDKLTMAHEWYLKHAGGARGHMGLEVTMAWEYADAMQAEADKRKPKPELPSLQQTFIDGVEKPRYAPSLDDWQPDWSVAPSSMITHWSKERNEICTWWIGEPCIDDETHFENPENPHSFCYSDAPSFDYKGNWKKSLRKRPQGI